MDLNGDAVPDLAVAPSALIRGGRGILPCLGPLLPWGYMASNGRVLYKGTVRSERCVSHESSSNLQYTEPFRSVVNQWKARALLWSNEQILTQTKNTGVTTEQSIRPIDAISQDLARSAHCLQVTAFASFQS